MSKVSNIIMMLQYLSYGRIYSAKELAKKLEVTPRMIRAYKDELEKAGIYLDTIYGPYGGYILRERKNIPKILFNEEDLNILEKTINKINDNELKTSINQLRNKVYLSYQEHCNDKFFFDETTKNKYNLISKAIKEKRKITISYHSKGLMKERVVIPFELFTYEDKWYVIVEYSLTTNDTRYLNLDRLEKITII